VGGLLLADAQSLRQVQVALVIFAPDVGQKAAALSDQLEQSSPGRLVVLVDPQVVRQEIDPFGQDGNLYLGASGIYLVAVEILDHLSLYFFIERHDVCCLLLLMI